MTEKTKQVLGAIAAGVLFASPLIFIKVFDATRSRHTLTITNLVVTNIASFELHQTNRSSWPLNVPLSGATRSTNALTPTAYTPITNTIATNDFFITLREPDYSDSRMVILDPSGPLLSLTHCGTNVFTIENDGRTVIEGNPTEAALRFGAMLEQIIQQFAPRLEMP